MVKISLPYKYSTLAQRARYHVFYGGRGSAKSWSVAQYLICRAMASPLKILCARELQNSITESVHSLLSEIIRRYQFGPWFRIKNNAIDCVNGSTFIFKGLAHNIDSVKSTEGVDLCWIEEADKVSQNSWDILIPTIRKDNSEFLITFNPTFDDDPVYQTFIANTEPNSIVVKVNYWDNPHFPDVLRLEMEHMRATNYEKYLHIWEGELRTISDAQVFKGKYAVREFATPEWANTTYYHGMDFGFANDPTAMTRAFICGNELFIDREQYGHHIEINQLGALARKIMSGSEYQRWQIKADCSRPETISYLQHEGLNVVGAKKWSGSVEDGIEYLKSFKTIVIHPRCKNTIEEFRRYSYKVDKRTNDILPVVLDDFNHCIDALRYSIGDLIKRNVTIYDNGVI